MCGWSAEYKFCAPESDLFIWAPGSLSRRRPHISHLTRCVFTPSFLFSLAVRKGKSGTQHFCNWRHSIYARAVKNYRVQRINFLRCIKLPRELWRHPAPTFVVEICACAIYHIRYVLPSLKTTPIIWCGPAALPSSKKIRKLLLCVRSSMIDDWLCIISSLAFFWFSSYVQGTKIRNTLNNRICYVTKFVDSSDSDNFLIIWAMQ